MADLLFVDFAVIPNPVRKEKQFRLPDDLFDLILSRTSHSAFGFPALCRVFTSCADLCSAIRKMFYTTRRNFNISALRGRNRRLVAAVI